MDIPRRRAGEKEGKIMGNGDSGEDKGCAVWSTHGGVLGFGDGGDERFPSLFAQRPSRNKTTDFFSF